MSNKLILILLFIIILLPILDSCQESDKADDVTQPTSLAENDYSNIGIESTYITETQTTAVLKRYKQEDAFSSDTVFVKYALTFAIENGVLWLSSSQGDVPEHTGLPNYTYSVYGMGYNLRQEVEQLAGSCIKYYAVMINVNTSPWDSESVKDYPANRNEKYEGKSIPEWFAYLDTLSGTAEYLAEQRKILGFVLDREKEEIESAGLEFCCLIGSSDTAIKYFAIATEEQIEELMNIGTADTPSDAPYLLTIANKITVMNGIYQTNVQVSGAIERYTIN